MINEYFDEVYVINLDERTDRIMEVGKELHKAKIDYNRISAVKLESLEDINTLCYDRFEHKEEKYIKGAIGCKLSHIKVIQHAKKEGYDKILILEDDVKVREDSNDLFKSILPQIESVDWDMLYLGGRYHLGGYYPDGSTWDQEQVDKNLLKLRGAMCTCGYALSKSIYDEILDYAFQSGQEIDIFYYTMHQFRRNFEYYGIIPEFLQQLDDDSDIK